MMGKALFVVLLILAILCIPVAAVNHTSASQEAQANAEDPVVINSVANSYGYLHIESVDITLKNTDADVVITYHIDPWLSVLVSLFAKDDLYKRILGALQYPETGYNQVVTFKYVDTDHAVLHITNAALDNMNNSYWFRAHTFGCTIPTLRIYISDDDIREYTNVKEMDKGIGYFKS